MFVLLQAKTYSYAICLFLFFFVDVSVMSDVLLVVHHDISWSLSVFFSFLFHFVELMLKELVLTNQAIGVMSASQTSTAQ